MGYEELRAKAAREHEKGQVGAGGALGELPVSLAEHGISTARNNAPCLLPNNLLHALPSGSNGATALALSRDGALVACAIHSEDRAVVAIYNIGSGQQRLRVHAHHRTIHELSWSADGQKLLSVSADGSAKLWRTTPMAGAEGEPLATLLHPSFVFCGKMQPPPQGGRRNSYAARRAILWPAIRPRSPAPPPLSRYPSGLCVPPALPPTARPRASLRPPPLSPGTRSRA